MATTALDSLNLAAAPPAPARRPRVLLVGTAFASAAAVATFAAIIGIYLSVRADIVRVEGAFLPDGASLPLSPGNMAAVTYLMSLVTMQWAVYSATNRDRGHAYLALGTTALFGVAAITQIGYLYTEWGVVLNGTEATEPAAVLLFVISGAHIAMTVAGLVFLALMTIRSLGGQFTGRDAEGLSAAALFWWVTVGIFMVIWYAVYITK